VLSQILVAAIYLRFLNCIFVSCFVTSSVQNRALSAIAQAESLRFKLIGGLAVRRACYGVMRYVMDNGAKGCEIIITGKMRAARAKAMKFRDGYMIRSGDAVNHYVDYAVRHIKLKQVSILLQCYLNTNKVCVSFQM